MFCFYQKAPILSSFSRILQALGCYDSATDPKGGPPADHEQWAIHAVQSFVWKIAGAVIYFQDNLTWLTLVRPGLVDSIPQVQCPFQSLKRILSSRLQGLVAQTSRGGMLFVPERNG